MDIHEPHKGTIQYTCIYKTYAYIAASMSCRHGWICRDVEEFEASY